MMIVHKISQPNWFNTTFIYTLIQELLFFYCLIIITYHLYLWHDLQAPKMCISYAKIVPINWNVLTKLMLFLTHCEYLHIYEYIQSRLAEKYIVLILLICLSYTNAQWQRLYAGAVYRYITYNNFFILTTWAI